MISRRLPLAAGLLALIFCARSAAAQQTTSLAQLQFDIVGVRLVVDPPALTVPKNIATQINTSLVLPASAGAEAREAIEALTGGALVEAELRGPDLSPTRIVTRPGQPIPLPPLAVPGDYFLDGIRLVKGGQTVLDATATDGRLATTIPIKVISEVFVTSVTSRPLSLDEIRGRGIVIDQTNFRTVSFQVAFNIDGTPFTIDVPAALPTPEFLQQRPTRAQIVEQLAAVNQRLRGLETALPPQFDRPGLNFSIAALPFFPVPEDDGGIPDLGIPPITGLVVIPGNVAFLNQFFSVLLMVTNVAPDGTVLELRETTARIVLPPGLDRVHGSYDQPGDDPLRLARLQGVGTQPVVPVVQAGADGVLGTADDIAVISPQRSGQGEFLVEGLKEGSHLFDIAIETTLFGLPSGPVRMSGQAAGAVFVRNPTFSVTLAHPRTIRSGEPYDLYATVTNTSQTIANLVSVGLEPRAISGAQLLSDPTVTFETLAPGQAVTAKFRLVAQKTGSVTFSSFTGEASSGGGIQLTTGIDERGVALAPNAIVLPKSADQLPASLVTAAQRVLGQAFSIATAPAEALPAGVLFVRRQTVIDRGIDLAQAGERLQFGEPLTRVVQDLLLDWLGNTTADAGFDQILRTTDAGAAFLGEIAAIVQTEAAGASVIAYQGSLANTGSGRNGHLSAAVGGTAGQDAPLLMVSRLTGGATGRSPSGVERSLESAATFDLANQAGEARLAVVARVEPARYRVQIVARANGIYDLGVVVPGGDGRLRHVRFNGVALDAGGIAFAEFDLSTTTIPTLATDRGGDGTAEGQAAGIVDVISESAPRVITARQLLSAYRETPGDLTDPATYGVVLGVLFDKPVTAASAEVRSNYTLEANSVIGARLQASGRLVYLYLERPVGALVPRTLTVANLSDAHGHVLPPTTQPIVMALSDGARVFGQVRNADGSGVPQSVLKLSVVVEARAFDVATIRTDANGAFDFDFVPRLGTLVLTAQHPVTLEVISLSARIRGAGQQLLLNPTFQGRGTVRGRVLAANGVTPVPGARVAVLPGAVLSSRGFETRTDALGEFTVANVPVGVFTVSAADATGGFGQITAVVAASAQTTTVDVVLSSRADEGGRVVGRVFMSDGATPGADFTVYVGRYDRDHARIEALGRTVTDAAGSFAIASTLPQGSYDVVAVDPASAQIGVAGVTVLARQTASVSIVLEATGTVEGVVFNARGEPLAGALVAGGLALVQTDGNGFFRMTGVPAGRRTIEAGDPITRRRGSAIVTVVPGQTVSAAITLESRATIVGRVLDAAGAPVPRATVRIPQLGGYTFVFANDSGVFRFPDLPLGDYLIQAPGPSRESLIEFMKANGYDPRSAFTSGDIPAELGGESSTSFGNLNAALGAYEQAVRTFLSVDETLLNGLPMANLGGFGWTKVQLFQDSTTETSDIRFLAKGTVSGQTLDSSNRPIGALTRITALGVSLTGFPKIVELARITTDAATGAFSFAGVPRFDLATFQRAGVRGGDFTVDAAHPFSPVIATFRGQLTTTAPNLANIVLRFPSATETNGTVRGRVLMPDGSAAPANTRIEISFGDLTVLTGADGRFDSPLPIPAGTYTITATTPGGLRGRTAGIVPAGGTLDITVQILGLGSATVVVKRPNGQAVAGALIALERGTFPGERLNGTTDANGQLHFVNVTEGAFSVSAEEPLTGLSGRASGIMVRDADVLTMVVITAAGRVTGRFFSADGLTTIPFAQVVLTSGAVRAFTTTDADGRFELTSIPIGRFTIDASDPASGRVGRASDELLFEGHAVDVAVLQVPRGVVRGFVVQSDGTTPVPGANVKLAGSGVVRTELQATTREDGSFRFEGISAGELTLVARDLVAGFEGQSTVRLTFENEVVDTTITLAPFGSIHVTVHDSAGAVAPNASVSVSRGQDVRTAAVDTTGQTTFEFLPLGTWAVVARSLADPGDGGHATATLTAGGETVDVLTTFRGTGTVAVTVVGSDGATRVPSARVTLTASAAPAGSAPGPMTTTLNGFTNGSGVVTFEHVPAGTFFVTAESAALAGISTGSVDAPGSAPAVTVQLGASGSVIGRVLLPDGLTPAAQAIVTLRFTPQSGLQSGILQVTTGLTGTFAFTGIPVGAVTLSAFEVVSSGVRTRAGQIAGNGQQLDLGDVVLDNASPRVTSVTPPDGSTGVSRLPALAVVFSEGMRSSSFSAANIALMDGASSVALAPLTFSSDGRTVTIRPLQPLRSNVPHSLVIRGGQDGPRDEGADLPLIDPFVMTFATADDVPPAVVSTSPASGDRQVSPEISIRVVLSEPIATGTLSLRESGGAAVPGTSSLVTGNTIVAFVPLATLRANAGYVATLAGVTDTAGNSLPSGAVTFTFSTIDTLAPQISALQIAGTARAGSTLTITPVFDAASAADVRRVDYIVGAATPSSATVTPFATTAVVPSGVTTLAVHATAFDEFGNRSSTFSQTVAVAANEPPQVALRTVAPIVSVAQGQSVEFEAVATDDAQLARVALSAVGAATFSEVRNVPGAQASFTTRFTVQIPATAPSSGTLIVQAAAVDAAGASSTPAIVTLPMSDGARPTLTVLSPVNNAQIVVGQPVTVTLDASDDVGVASVSLSCVPALTGCETRVLQPAQVSTRQTFTVTVPSTVAPGSNVVMLVRVADTAGNSTELGRTLLIPDTVAPTVSSLETVSGSTRVVAGESTVLRAIFSDNIGVAAVTFLVDGAAVPPGTTTVAPPTASGEALVSFVVPAGTANGTALTVRVRARDVAGNQSDERTLVLSVGDTAAPTVTILTPAAGTTLIPGQAVSSTVRATDDAALQRVVFTVSGVVSATETRLLSPPVAASDLTFAFTVPAGSPAGTVTLAAEAFDLAGNSSGSVTRTLTVADAIAPSVRIVSPAGGTSIDPRNPLNVVVEATDGIGVTEMTFTAAGAASALETRAVTPAQALRTETFVVAFPAPPISGGTLSLNASARDAAGNVGIATGVSLSVLDVVAPAVTSIAPSNGATNVDTGIAVAIAFSEPMARATLTPATIRLSAGATAVPSALTIAPDDRSVTLTPNAPLAVNTLYTVTIESAATDRAGNALPASVTTFRTSTPDTTPPHVVSIDPADNAVGVATTSPIAVTFSEPIDPQTVSPASFRVLVGVDLAAGSLGVNAAGDVVTFTPAAPWPFEAVVVTDLRATIKDVAGNALTPATFTFATGNFAITSPAGAAVVEGSRVTLTAQASAALNVASVVFSINGVALPAVAAAPFTTAFTAPAASVSPSVTIVASARNAQNSEIARAVKIVTVVDALRMTPGLIGIPRGATRTLRLSIANPLAEDLPIALSAADVQVVTVAPADVVLVAGQTTVTADVTACTTCPWDPVATGKAAGNTAVIAHSSRGDASTIVSVSDPVAGQQVTALSAPAGLAISTPPSAGHAFTTASQQSTMAVQLLAEPLEGSVPLEVTVTSSNPAVATATVTAIQPGQRTALITIHAVGNGIAVLTLRAGNVVRSFTVYVGPQPAGVAPLVLASPTGLSISLPPSAGQIIVPAGRTTVVTVPVLSADLTGGSPATVTVISSNPAVATATATPVQPGTRVTTLTITSIGDGVATITLIVNGEVRSFTVRVGAPPPAQTPLVLAQPTGISVGGLPFIGTAAAQPGATFALGILLLAEPAPTAMTVTVTSSDPSVASVTGPATIAAGSRMVTITITTGAAGTAVLTLEVGSIRREFALLVGGTLAPSRTPLISAPPVGVSVVPAPLGVGRLTIPAGSAVNASVGVQVLTSARATPTTVTVTSSNPAVVGFAAGSQVTTTIAAGGLVVPLDLASTGATGAAILRFEIDGAVKELLVVVGNPAPSEIPAVVAPVIGVRIDQ